MRHKGTHLTSKTAITKRIEAQLDAAAAARDILAEEPDAPAKREALRVWQAARLARTHADLLQSPRYAKTASFFLNDIYGPKDLSRHERAVRGILPWMTALLPEAGLETVADAFELNALSEALDAAILKALGGKAFHITDADYAEATRKVGHRADRERQIALILQLGQSLDRFTRKPLIGATLTMMRGPAIAAGLGDLQSFLERGYAAFRRMNGAQQFLNIVVSREKVLLKETFADVGDAL
jgi:hypothetical protein